MTRKGHDIRIGQIYVDAKLPKHEWRISAEDSGVFTLVRADDPHAYRYVEAETLLDTIRYRRKH